MFETAAMAAAMVREIRQNEAIADRRAFYGPDAAPISEETRSKVRLPRFMRRGSNVA